MKIDKSKLTKVVLPTAEPAVKSAGLGDAVAKVLKPFVSMVDKTFHTHLTDCGGCRKRREALNKAMPFQN